MIGLVLRRIGWTIVVAWFAVSLTFAMLVTIPADPARALLGPHADEEEITRVKAHYCLDHSVVTQYGCFVGNVAMGDLGTSIRSKRPVADIIVEKLWATLQLAVAAILLQLAIGIPLGMIAASRRGRWPDRAAGMVGLIGQSAPSFFVGTVLLYLFAYQLGWFPISGYGEGVWDRIHHLMLPAMTLATLGVAYYARIVRGELVDVLGEDYIRTARAKGLSEWRVVGRHGLRNALPPVITLIGLDLGALLGGAVVIEYIFAWPGLGREVLQAILEVDHPLVIGVVLVSAIAIAIANLFADLVNLWLDPRLRER